MFSQKTVVVLLFFSTIWAILLASISTYRLITELSEISELRTQTVALAEKNEITSTRIESTLSTSSESVKDLENKFETKTQTILSDLEKSYENLQHHVFKLESLHKKISSDNSNNNKKNKKENNNDRQGENDSEQQQSQPKVFGEGGSHLLEGSQSLMALERKWGYPEGGSGDDALQLHRQLLGQCAIAARTLEAQCALQAWREYLDQFIIWMEKRQDTMLYNWI